MVSKKKYVHAVCILNYITIDKTYTNTVESKTDNENSALVSTKIECRKKAFMIIFDKLADENDYKLAIDLARRFKKTSLCSSVKERDDEYNYYQLIVPLICNIIGQLLRDNNFDLTLSAVRALGSKNKICQINMILDCLFQKSPDWKVSNYKIILTFYDEMPQTTSNERNIEFLNLKLKFFCTTLIKEKYFVEAKEVISHVRSALMKQFLESRLAAAQS
ncbi:MAG: hypothetical protein ACD_20C00426G0002 [uncultured bacterium]|nr:MAG: hypothetical protein ACD_20C00426G0002 [uncultured bacterium]